MHIDDGSHMIFFKGSINFLLDVPIYIWYTYTFFKHDVLDKH